MINMSLSSCLYVLGIHQEDPCIQQEQGQTGKKQSCLPVSRTIVVQCNSICHTYSLIIYVFEAHFVHWDEQSRDNVITRAKKCHLWGGSHCACIRFNTMYSWDTITIATKWAKYQFNNLKQCFLEHSCCCIRLTFLQSVLEARSSWSYLAKGGAQGAPIAPVRIACKSYFRLLT